jgi:alpha-L-fucosidase 2
LTEQLDKAAKRPYAVLLAAHVTDYQALFNRVTLDNGKTDAAIAALPTPKRLAAYKQANAQDPELENLLFQYGRYLLMGSSRGALPANLQGLWNNSQGPARPRRLRGGHGVGRRQADLSDAAQPYRQELPGALR